MRIMMISTHGYVAAEPELGKPDTGGQVVYVLELSKHLAALGHHVDILTRRFGNQLTHENISDRIRLFRFPCGGKDFIPKETLCHAIPEWVDYVERYLRESRQGYDLINSHYWDGGLAGQTLANHLGIPHTHTPHSIGAWKRDSMDGDPEELERRYNFRHRIREEKVIYDECDAVVATTQQQRDILMTSEYDVPTDKIHVIPPGYDDGRFFPVSLEARAAAKRKLDLEGPIVLALGRMARNKGYDLLIRAMSTLFYRVKKVKLLLAVGSKIPSEDETEQIEKMQRQSAAQGTGNRVLFRNYIPDDQLADHYRAADVFALSSRYEPFGMTAVEAMACGTPTVVTTEGGLWKELTYGREVLYANPFDSDAFGYAIATILMYPRVRDRLAKYGSQKVRADYTWAGVARRLLKVLEEVKSRET